MAKDDLLQSAKDAVENVVFYALDDLYTTADKLCLERAWMLDEFKRQVARLNPDEEV